MPENSLISKISFIFESLKCKEIIDFLNQWNIDKSKLLSLTIESKLGYDLISTDPECKSFIDDIEESSVYEVNEYSQLIMFISTMGDITGRFNSEAISLNKFLLFHKTLYKTGTLIFKLMNEEGIHESVTNNFIGNPLKSDSPESQGPPSKIVSLDFSKIVTPQTQKQPQPVVQNIRDEKIVQNDITNQQNSAQSQSITQNDWQQRIIQNENTKTQKTEHQHPIAHNDWENLVFQNENFNNRPIGAPSQSGSEMFNPGSDHHEYLKENEEMTLQNFLKSLSSMDIPVNT